VEDLRRSGVFSVHQFCASDVRVYRRLDGDHPGCAAVFAGGYGAQHKNYGINAIGWSGKDFRRSAGGAATRYRLLLQSKMNTSQAVAEMRGTLAESEDVQELIQFIEKAERGL